MKAALVGCKNDDDGILDQWAGKVNFAVMDFGSGIHLDQDFHSTKAQLEAAVRKVPANGYTPMTRGILESARHFKRSFTNATVAAGQTATCRPNFIIILSDGAPNGSPWTYDVACNGDRVQVASNQPWFGSAYLHDHSDILCQLDGDQRIDTYAIGFGSTSGASTLTKIANEGGGEYYYASNASALSQAFEAVVSDIVSKAALTMAPAAIQTDTLYDGNTAFAPAFRPSNKGPWMGTLKKYCVNPPLTASGRYDTSVENCMFKSEDGKTLLTNPSVQDQFTGDSSLDASQGGVAAVLKKRLADNSGKLRTPYYPRNILSWHLGGKKYTRVNPSTWKEKDSWLNAEDHIELINFLHGYTYDADTRGYPVDVRKAPLGDPVHFDPTILRFGPCEASNNRPIRGRCYAVVGANDGMLHLFDIADGKETSALIPAELWMPSGVASSQLQALKNQPSHEFTHRYYVDGAPRLYHDDTDGDGFIDRDEDAMLLFGLGRGGRAYYALSLNEMQSGQLTASKTPIYPITRAAGTAFAELEETWSAPTVGKLEFEKKDYTAAVFPSGHVRQLDFTMAQTKPPPAPTPVPNLNNAETRPCKDVKNSSGTIPGFAEIAGVGNGWCEDMYSNSCAKDACYDKGPDPVTKTLAYHEDRNIAAALRLHFDQFDLDPNDQLRLLNAEGKVLKVYTQASPPPNGWTAWVYGPTIQLQMVSDGKNNTFHGYAIDSMTWVRGPEVDVSADAQKPGRDPNFKLGVDHRPTVYVADLAKWNGSQRTPFAATPSGDGLLFRITNDCNGVDTDRCVDQDDFSDLQYMVCPISSGISPYTEGEKITRLYWGDECGQLWRAWMDTGDKNKWKVRRLINLNGGKVGMTENYRKIFRHLDLVLTACPGKRVVGIHFGTGNVQRPLSKTDLQDSNITNGQDIIGLFWDELDLPKAALTEKSGLRDVTDTLNLKARDIYGPANDRRHGWYVRLEHSSERMLRDPFVFDGVAYYKTYQPITIASECGAGSGLDRIYAVDNCSGAPEKDTDEDGDTEKNDRMVWSGNTEIGSNILFTAPKNAPVLISHGNLAVQEKASLTEKKRSRPGLYLWREK